MLLLLAFLIGVIAGLRAMTAPAAIAWAATLGWIDLSGSWASFMGSIWAAGILTLLALGEYVTDQLPATPSRKVPVQFATRIIVGAFCGAAIGTPSGGWLICLVAGLLGAVAGTLGGAAFRARLAASFGRDPPAAFVEDAIAIIGAFLVMTALPVSASMPIPA
ncbi:DUF4126 family protein [Rhizobium sp. NFR03]|uniref:DUF4126 family protein n=1 Tax=Rhizobium sp. NFR03 TaxID=1566263 RepID=UPI0008AB92B4|nr:DUF4126 family protein [Rhizobium sp. NFR03]SES21181.1 Uncharacterized membrane protein [Rhizobium sp. NFR03]